MTVDPLLRALRWLRPALLLLLAASVLLYVVRSLHWPVMWDTSVMHYVQFLMAHGREPYTDITDMNMPGTYLFEWLGMHLFGPGDLAWRLYDFALSAVLVLAATSIARPYDWFAGTLAGGLFVLIHASDGPLNAVERDQVMTVLLAVSYAFLFAALRRNRPALLSLFALAAGLAAAVKPTVVPLAVALFLLALVTTRRRHRPLLPVIASGLAGFAVATVLVLSFLLRHHALSGFLFILRDVLPHYASVDPAPISRILYRILPPAIAVLVPVGLFLSLRRSVWARAELTAVLLGAAFGALSFLSQRKGYFYHRYTVLFFVLLWITVELTRAFRPASIPHTRMPRLTAIATLVFLLAAIIPLFAIRILRTPAITPYTVLSETLESDLARIAPRDQLQNEVQCLDLVYGCLNALRHLGLVENTSSTGDLLYFLPSDAPVVLHYRSLFWQSLQTHPPNVIVLSNEWYSQNDTFTKIQSWPAFASLLGEKYTLRLQRSFGPSGELLPLATPDPRQPSYRIYLRR